MKELSIRVNANAIFDRERLTSLRASSFTKILLQNLNFYFIKYLAISFKISFSLYGFDINPEQPASIQS